MKKNAYISPSVETIDSSTETDILAASPNGTNIEGLGVAEENAPADMEGRSRLNLSIWDDED